MDSSVRNEKATAIARDVLKLSRNTLLVHMRFLDSAVSRLQPVEFPVGGIATDGQYLVYDVYSILRAYREGKEAVPRMYLHTVLHGIFRHMFVGASICRPVWDLACDIAVENAIRDMDLSFVQIPNSAHQASVLQQIKKEMSVLSAEKIYRFFMDQHLTEKQIQEARDPFCADKHDLWYMPPDEKKSMLGMGDNSRDGNTSDSEPSTHQPDALSNNQQKQKEPMLSRAELEQEWTTIGERALIDLETTSRMLGDRAGGLMQELRAVNRERYDYADFLRRFATLGEIMQINDDEFDYVFYTYGLKLYENMPLIESLEYKEVKRIKEFVIAIDTSRSTSGKLVQAFLNKTYNIFLQQENFFTRIHVRIIQCDTVIQGDARITCREDFDEYLAHMQLRGMGGTDFRPVFDYVDQLIRDKEFTNLKGMIYFTDGCGVFPTHRPAYDTAFVFIDDEYNNYNVPVWAMKLILQKEDITI